MVRQLKSRSDPPFGALIALTGDGAGTTSFSGRRQGLAYYFARLVRPIWKMKITKLG
jgi:hypothetical protein